VQEQYQGGLKIEMESLLE